ncbi:MAG TPA: redoxin domain-containing protein [Chitinophagaceae bacterium]
MKQIILYFLLLSGFQSLFGQKDSVQAPYQRFPSFPPVELTLADGNKFHKDDLAKKTPVMLMLFSPDCEHCQHETEELIKNIDKFKKIQVVMATQLPFESMLAFREKYGLAKYSNITVGHDKQYFLPVFYNIRNLPFHAFYDRKKELISAFEGSMTIEKVLAELTK